jgi:hypothetical protein
MPRSSAAGYFTERGEEGGSVSKVIEDADQTFEKEVLEAEFPMPMFFIDR